MWITRVKMKTALQFMCVVCSASPAVRTVEERSLNKVDQTG